MTAQARPALLGAQIYYGVPEIAHILLTDTRDELALLASLCATVEVDESVSAFALSRQYARLASQLTDVLDSCDRQR